MANQQHGTDQHPSTMNPSAWHHELAHAGTNRGEHNRLLYLCYACGMRWKPVSPKKQRAPWPMPIIGTAKPHSHSSRIQSDGMDAYCTALNRQHTWAQAHIHTTNPLG